MWNNSQIEVATSISLLATIAAAGLFLAISSAKVGPVNIESDMFWNLFSTISLKVSPFLVAKPFEVIITFILFLEKEEISSIAVKTLLLSVVVVQKQTHHSISL